MSETPATIVLRKLSDLADKANTSETAIAMDEVFDGQADSNMWIEAWAKAKLLVGDTLETLKQLVGLADKADASPTAIAMQDVFDGSRDADEWREAWSMARAVTA